MNQYFVDTNFFLRFLLKDNPAQFEVAYKYFERAKKGEIVLNLTSFVVFELIFGLETKYSFSKNKVFDFVSSLLSLPYIKLEESEIIQNTVFLYFRKNIDFVDCYLKAKSDFCKAEVLSFDKDFKKLDNDS